MLTQPFRETGQLEISFEKRLPESSDALFGEHTRGACCHDAFKYRSSLFASLAFSSRVFLVAWPSPRCPAALIKDNHFISGKQGDDAERGGAQ